MTELLKKHQDTMVNYTLKAKQLQNESGLQVGLKIGDTNFVSVDAVLQSLLRMPTREDLKEKINEALR